MWHQHWSHYWCHEHLGFSNHQQLRSLFKRLFRLTTKKMSNFTLQPLVDSLYKGREIWKLFPCHGYHKTYMMLCDTLTVLSRLCWSTWTEQDNKSHCMYTHGPKSANMLQLQSCCVHTTVVWWHHTHCILQSFDTFALGGCGSDFKSIIFKLIIFGTDCRIVLGWMTQNLIIRSQQWSR